MPFTVLLVDDDRAFREEFRDILQEEYAVLESSSGEEALALLAGPHVVDLVILDVKLPGMPGTEVLARIKAGDPALPIVMFTGSDSREVLLNSLRGHADDFLQKPLRVPQALRTIKALLDQRRDGVQGVIDKIKYAIEKNFHKNISLEEAAALVFLSPKYISRFFKRHMGMGFTVYKNHVRIEQAKEMMRETDLHIKEISYKVGYQNPESFIRLFKKIVGETPAQFRRRETRAGAEGDSRP